MNGPCIFFPVRPCPYYSQGRCLFADSCNFIHTIKTDYEPASEPYGIHSDVSLTLPNSDQRAESSRMGSMDGAAKSGEERFSFSFGHTGSETDSRRASSQSMALKRRSVRSPPRSPRMSGLLFALQSVIGPDEEDEEGEEFEEEENLSDGDGEGEGEDADPADTVLRDVNDKEVSSASRVEVYSESSSPRVESNFVLPTVDIVNASTTTFDNNGLLPPASPFDGSFSVASDGAGFSFLSDFPTPPSNLEFSGQTSTPKRSPSSRPKILSPIITQHTDGISSHVLDDHTLEVHTQPDSSLTPSHNSARLSTFDLLSSPFASPSKRPLFLDNEPRSPLFGMLSGTTTPIRQSRAYADDDLESLETLESPTDNILKRSEDEAQEGPASDYSRTPRGNPYPDEFDVSELEDLPPLPPSLAKAVREVDNTFGGRVLNDSQEEEYTITAISQYDISPYDLFNPSPGTSFASSEPSDESHLPASHSHTQDALQEQVTDPADDDIDDANELDSPTIRLGQIGTPERHYSTGSLVDCYSSDPSPVSSDPLSAHTSETLVEPDILLTPLESEKPIKERFSRASLTSPTKMLRESSCPPALDKIARATPSPLMEELPRPASSLSSTSSKVSWAEISRKTSISQKVPFGFRQSITLVSFFNLSNM